MKYLPLVVSHIGLWGMLFLWTTVTLTEWQLVIRAVAISAVAFILLSQAYSVSQKE